MTNGNETREARLAAALRDNLKRRKAQARATAAGAATVPPPDPVMPGSDAP